MYWDIIIIIIIIIINKLINNCYKIKKINIVEIEIKHNYLEWIIKKKYMIGRRKGVKA
jgi:hypothetical protein